MNQAWKEKIEKSVAANEIMVFMRGTPDEPRCGFSARVVKVLRELNSSYKTSYGTENMDSDPELWQTLKELNDGPTSPQIYVKGEFIGGCDIFVEMYQNGSLQKMLKPINSL